LIDTRRAGIHLTTAHPAIHKPLAQATGLVLTPGTNGSIAMPNFVKKLIVEPGSKVKLRDIDPDYHAKFASRDAALPEIQTHLQRMDRLQYLMYAEKKHSLLIVLQGLDASGKDGVVRHVITGMNPTNCLVTTFKHPTAEELRHDFLWRVHPHVPGKGDVAIFNRSHYEDVLIVRVHKLVPEKQWSKRYHLVNDFERLLAVENGTTILKFLLYISKDEQLTRFKQRLDDPNRHWKVSEADYQERAYWDDYMAAFEDMLRKTSTDYAPWFVIPANHKWFRDLAVSQIITRSLEDLDMKFPKPTVDLAEIARKYHMAEEQGGGKK
jgi:PPK2 family polyphosphate:nucleotide phosphotransferase